MDNHEGGSGSMGKLVSSLWVEESRKPRGHGAMDFTLIDFTITLDALDETVMGLLMPE